MLFRPVGTSKMNRIQGAFVTEEEIAKVCNFWAKQGEPDFDEELLEAKEPEVEEGAEGEFSPDQDDLLADAARIVVESETASVSMIQRRLRVGYTRAGRLIDMLERRGIISGYEGSKPRQVLVSQSELPRLLERLASGDDRRRRGRPTTRRPSLASSRSSPSRARPPPRRATIGRDERRATGRDEDRRAARGRQDPRLARPRRGRGSDQDPSQVPARARGRALGRSAEQRLCEGISAQLRGAPRPRRRGDRRRVPPPGRGRGGALDAPSGRPGTRGAPATRPATTGLQPPALGARRAAGARGRGRRDHRRPNRRWGRHRAGPARAHRRWPGRRQGRSRQLEAHARHGRARVPGPRPGRGVPGRGRWGGADRRAAAQRRRSRAGSSARASSCASRPGSSPTSWRSRSPARAAACRASTARPRSRSRRRATWSRRGVQGRTARERPRRNPGHRDRGDHCEDHRPQRPLGLRAARRARNRGRPHPRRRRPPRGPRGGAAVHGRGGLRPDRHQRRAGSDRRRPDRRDRRALRRGGARARHRDGGEDRRDHRRLRPADAVVPTMRCRRRIASRRWSRGAPKRSTRPGPHRGWWFRSRTARSSSSCQVRRASCTPCGRRRWRPRRSARCSTGPSPTRSRRCGCSACPSPRSRSRCARSAPRRIYRRSRSPPACAAASSRSTCAIVPAPISTARRSSPGWSSATSGSSSASTAPTIDEQVAALLRDGPHDRARRSPCTAGLLAARLADPPGASALPARRRRRLLQPGEDRAARRAR